MIAFLDFTELYFIFTSTHISLDCTSFSSQLIFHWTVLHFHLNSYFTGLYFIFTSAHISLDCTSFSPQLIFHWTVLHFHLNSYFTGLYFIFTSTHISLDCTSFSPQRIFHWTVLHFHLNSYFTSVSVSPQFFSGTHLSPCPTTLSITTPSEPLFKNDLKLIPPYTFFSFLCLSMISGSKYLYTTHVKFNRLLLIVDGFFFNQL